MQDSPYYPRLDEDQQLRMEEERAAYARDHLQPSDVLSEVQSLMLGIADDRQHPLFLPLIDRAITRLVTEALAQEVD
jgi:hypothetical protein